MSLSANHYCCFPRFCFLTSNNVCTLPTIVFVCQPLLLFSQLLLSLFQQCLYTSNHCFWLPTIIVVFPASAWFHSSYNGWNYPHHCLCLPTIIVVFPAATITLPTMVETPQTIVIVCQPLLLFPSFCFNSSNNVCTIPTFVSVLPTNIVVLSAFCFFRSTTVYRLYVLKLLKLLLSFSSIQFNVLPPTVYCTVVLTCPFLFCFHCSLLYLLFSFIYPFVEVMTLWLWRAAG